MQITLVAALAFVCVFGGALTGVGLRRALPAEHLGQDTKEVIFWNWTRRSAGS